MVRTKGVGTQSSRAVIQMGFLSSRTEIDFHWCKLERVFYLVDQKTQLDCGSGGLGSDIQPLDQYGDI